MRAAVTVGRAGGLGGITTWDPARKEAAVSLSGGDRVASVAGSTYAGVRATPDRAPPVAATHYEMTVISTGAGNGARLGISQLGQASLSGFYIDPAGILTTNGGGTPVGMLAGGALVPGDVIAFEPSGSSIYVQRLGQARQGPFSNGLSSAYSPWAMLRDGGAVSLNTGQDPFILPLTPGFQPYG